MLSEAGEASHSLSQRRPCHPAPWGERLLAQDHSGSAQKRCPLHVMQLRRGVEFATACGAFTCTKPGAIGAQPTAAEAEALLSAQGAGAGGSTTSGGGGGA